MKMYRQGDVLLREVKAIPRQHFEVTERKSKIVLHGEATGHSHALEGDASILDVRKTGWEGRGDNGAYVEVRSPTNLVHEEHDTIELPEGVYYVVRQREFDEKEVRYVRD